MNGRVCLLLAAALVAPNAALAQDGRKSFTLSPDGQWQQAKTPTPSTSASPDQPGVPTSRPVDSAALDRVDALIRAGSFDEAFRADVDWLKTNQHTDAGDRGLYLAAVALKGKLDLVRAFYYCDQLLDEHPESRRYQDALTLQYEMADLYLNGLKDTLLGLRIVARDDVGIDMLFRIQQRAPGSPVAEKALLRTADYYWSNEDFDLAGDAYQSYVKSYPRSPLVPQARLREAYANLAQFRGPAFDAASILNARTLLNQLIVDYPDLAKQEDLPAKLELADRQLARKLVIRADYYRRTGQPASAAKLCRRAIDAYPNLPETQDARAMLARLEPSR